MPDSLSVIDAIRSSVRLVRAANLSLNIRSNNEVRIEWRGRDLHCGAHGLAVLNAFARPRSVVEVLRLLGKESSGVQDWEDLTRTILQLQAEGVLQESGTIEPSFTRMPKGFDKPRIHIKMLNDRKRTEGLIAAIRETIRPGDVVLDIGTGTGILAIAAARAGAGHVYAIEAGAIGRVAREVVAANSLQNRITVIEGWSTQVSLPEPADFFVSEIIGNDPFAERILEVTLDARRRLLKPGARQVPRAIEVWGLPVAVPPGEVNKNRFTSELRRNWLDWYGIDFGPLVDAGRGHSSHFVAEPHSTRCWQTFTDPVLLSRTDLRTVSDISIATESKCLVDREGTINGLVVFFKSDLCDGHWLSTNPSESTPDNSWMNRVEILSEPLPVRPGDTLTISYSYMRDVCECGTAIRP